MFYRQGKTDRELRSRLFFLVGTVTVSSVLYIPLDRGSVLSDAAEIAAPLAISVALLCLAGLVRCRAIVTDRLRHIARYASVGAVVAVVASLLLFGAHLVFELSLSGLDNEILTLWSLGIGGGVLAGAAAGRQFRTAREPSQRSPIEEATWTAHSSDQPILSTIVATLSALDGVSTLDLNPIYDTVDPSLFETLRQSRDDVHWQLTCHTNGYEVRVSSMGTVTVYEDRTADASTTLSFN
jgi:hypothetical protein